MESESLIFTGLEIPRDYKRKVVEETVGVLYGKIS